MLFNSFEFIFLFLPIVLGFYFSPISHRLRLFGLLVASYVFYGYWSYQFLGLLMFSTTLDYFLGIWIYRQKSQTNKKRLVVLSVLVNLGILGFFKYFNFFADNFYTLNNLINQDSSRSFFLEIVLPVGISFYTFQSMSYTLDVYYGSTKPHYDYLSFATYVAFFPQLVAGPIVRHSDLVYQLEDPKRGIFESTNFSKGVILFVFGLSKKMLLADRLAEAVDPALNSLTFLSTAESWLVAIGYTLQLYFDFSGYSDMAIGLGKMMNFDFPINFNSPYRASSITEFWKRWHMTLSTWLRDYLYIPLGGNRQGPLKTYRNLLVTMVLGGLWHGANWVYIVWGFYHGLLLSIERVSGRAKGYFALSRLNVGLTFVLVVVGWVFFRSPNLNFAGHWLAHMWLPPYDFSLHHFVPKVRDRFAIALIVASALVFLPKKTLEMRVPDMITMRYAMVAALLFLLSISFFSANSPFLYFQF